MNAKIIDMPKNPIETLYRSFKTCVSKCNPTEIVIPQTIKLSEYDIEQYVPDKSKMIDLIKRHISHESVLEHCNITFAIEGVSRSLSHQLVRHRIASYSQQSQRYVKLGQFKYVIPSEIAKDPALKLMFEDHMIRTQELYDYTVKSLMVHGRTEKEAIEDARYVFPNACYTNLVVTFNLRTFRHFYSERDCVMAQWEIRGLAKKMMEEVKAIIPFADYKAKKCGISCFECKEGK